MCPLRDPAVAIKSIFLSQWNALPNFTNLISGANEQADNFQLCLIVQKVAHTIN